jgi:GntR family transcriptional regulator, transcriptional repressor for pyruvate dehydrogenase complex
MSQVERLIQPLDRLRLYDQIAEQLRGMIDDGTLKPGDRLPPERDLAERFRVSRNSVRDAYRALEAKGLIETRQGDGTYVREAHPREMYESIIEFLVTQKEAIRDIILVRMIVEPGIAYYAAKNATSEFVDRLERILEHHEQAVAEGDPGVEDDARFHTTLTEMTGNQFLCRLLEFFDAAFSETRGTLLTYSGTSSRLGHRRILAAIRDRNAIEARSAMLSHIEEVMATYDLLEAKEG